MIEKIHNVISQQCDDKCEVCSINEDFEGGVYKKNLCEWLSEVYYKKVIKGSEVK